MANITKFLEKKLLEHSVGKASWTSPTSGGTFAALFTVTPTVDYLDTTNEDGHELTQSGYSRLAITWNNAVANTDLTNSSKIVTSGTAGVNDLVWTADGNWGTIVAVGIFNTGVKGTGDLLWFGPLSANAVLAVSGDTLTIPAGSLTLTLA